jgi:hypothetical protein
VNIGDQINVFYSYAHVDATLRDELDNHLSLLRQSGFITQWYDRNISAGTDWVDQIDQHLNTAHIILLLVSSDFLASNYCYSIEMKRALERHEAGEARVIPILLRPVDWQEAPFAKLQVLPQNASPVTAWTDRDLAFRDIAIQLRNVVKGLREAQANTSSDRVKLLDSQNPQAVLGSKTNKHKGGQSLTLPPVLAHLDREGKFLESQFAYDVFISYRQQEPDKTWVRRTLVPKLEAYTLRTCIDYRDFRLGASLIGEMERAIEQSCYTLAILSSAYLQSNFTELENILAQHLGLENSQRRLLAVMREACTPRLGMRAHLWLDMTNDKEVEANMPLLAHELQLHPSI